MINSKLAKSIMRYLLCMISVPLVWRALEIVLYGHPTPNSLDSLIGIILAVSLWLNIELVLYYKD